MGTNDTTARNHKQPSGRTPAMTDEKIYDVPVEWRTRAHVDDDQYRAMYERSIRDPEGF